MEEIQRDIGKPVIRPTKFTIGCMSVLDCGSGWLKVSLHEKASEPLAELLPPLEAKLFVKWLQPLPMFLKKRESF
ncbi:MAG: hypothetical protein ABFD79_00010 [Phycisphaerales bacterium]